VYCGVVCYGRDLDRYCLGVGCSFFLFKKGLRNSDSAPIPSITVYPAIDVSHYTSSKAGDAHPFFGDAALSPGDEGI